MYDLEGCIQNFFLRGGGKLLHTILFCSQMYSTLVFSPFRETWALGWGVVGGGGGGGEG